MASSADGPLYLVAVIRPFPDRADEAQAQLRALMAATLSEPGCEYMELVASADEPGTWFMFEKFLSRALWDAHMATTHVRDGNAALASLLRQPTELRFYSELPATR